MSETKEHPGWTTFVPVERNGRAYAVRYRDLFSKDEDRFPDMERDDGQRKLTLVEMVDVRALARRKAKAL